MSKSKILFSLSGSIACYKSAFVISKLVQAGHEVQTVCTRGALQFVGEATLEGLTGRPVFKDIYNPGQMMGHIDFAKWADISILCPASANTINKLAAGLADDVVSSLFLAFDLKKPYLIMPAMNQMMYNHPATRKALETLKSWNVKVFETDVGHQACGDIGPGRLLEPEEILKELAIIMEKKS